MLSGSLNVETCVVDAASRYAYRCAWSSGQATAPQARSKQQNPIRTPSLPNGEPAHFKRQAGKVTYTKGVRAETCSA